MSRAVRRPRPIRELPPGYREVLYLALLTPRRALLLNVAALVPLAAALLLLLLWAAALVRLRGPQPGGPDLPMWLWVIVILALVLPLHEWFHGLAIHWAGHRPRYGLMLRKGALYATADGALFPRDVFLVIALAPLAGITLLSMALMLLLPDGWHFVLALAAALNAGSAIGDLWMAAAVWRRPADALVRDEMDSIRVYLRDQNPPAL